MGDIILLGWGHYGLWTHRKVLHTSAGDTSGWGDDILHTLAGDTPGWGDDILHTSARDTSGWGDDILHVSWGHIGIRDMMFSTHQLGTHRLAEVSPVQQVQHAKLYF